jgi:RNA polymerase sigma-70 factor (ECF subfamily)
VQHADPDLVALALQGDKAAFAELVGRHRPSLVTLCRRMLGDQALAEDAAQEAVLAAWLGLDRLRRPDRFGAWLVGIGLNVCRNMLRTRRWDQPLDSRIPDNGGDPHEAAEAMELAEAVQRAIVALPPGQRAAATLFFLEDMSYRDVADALDIGIGAVKTRLYKGRVRLRDQLSDQWKEKPMPVPVRVSDVHRLGDERFVVVLQEQPGDRRLPIWIGQAEACALAFSLESADLPRPGPYHLVARLLELAGWRLRQARIDRLEGGTFYAALEISGPGGDVTLDARPSDALNLALQVGAQITVEPTVLDAVEQGDPRWGADRVIADSQATAPGIVQEVRERMEAVLRSLQEKAAEP